MCEAKYDFLTVRDIQRTLKIGTNVAYNLIHSKAFTHGSKAPALRNNEAKSSIIIMKDENWRLPWQISVVQMAKGAGGSSPIAHGYIKSRSAGKKTALRKGNRLRGKQRRSASRERKSGLRNRNT